MESRRINLAAAWRPRGELNRFLKLFHRLREAYQWMNISLPPQTGGEIIEVLQNLPQVSVNLTPDWSWGRFTALRGAIHDSISHIQYADFDRMLRWVETNPAEWQRTIGEIFKADCLIIGRSDAAYQTHPQALIQTEALSNQVTSQFLGMQVDVSAGSKGFSRQAAEFIVANCKPGHALGTDAEWPIILNRAGFKLSYVEVDGLDWESADRYRQKAADQLNQKEAAENYDANPENWAERVGVAMEIIQMGISTMDKIIYPQKG
jgi:hypothetical protein